MAVYRNDVDALSARHDGLAAELAAKTKEVNDAARLLEEARTRARLPVLDNLRVATPCRADWNQMTGDERTRHCGDCKKSVFNLSNLTREEAEALIVEKAGKLCARYYQRHDGTILLKDCSIGIGKQRKRRIVALGAFAMLGTGALYAFLRPTSEKPEVPTCALPPSHESTGVRTIGATAVEPPPAAHERELMGEIGAVDPNAQMLLGDIE